MKALITQPGKTAGVQEVPVPSITDDEILVKVVAVAQNPTDWKCTHPHTYPRSHAFPLTRLPSHRERAEPRDDLRV